MAVQVPTDAQILEAFQGRTRLMTYVVTNTLRSAGFSAVKTPFVLRRLKALEALGKVKRMPSSYEVQICWSRVGGAV